MQKLTQGELETVGRISANTIILGDCLDVMPYIADGSVNAIIADPPYG